MSPTAAHYLLHVGTPVPLLKNSQLHSLALGDADTGRSLAEGKHVGEPGGKDSPRGVLDGGNVKGPRVPVHAGHSPNTPSVTPLGHRDYVSDLKLDDFRDLQ